MGGTPRAVGIRPLLEVGFKDWLQDELKRSLDHPVPDGRNRQNALALAIALWGWPDAGTQWVDTYD